MMLKILQQQQQLLKLRIMKKRILRSLTIAAAVAVSSTSFAQLPDDNKYDMEHIVTDIEGVDHDIQAILSSGKAVIIDAFADWCGPCWSYHVGGTLEELHDELPYVKIFGLEADPGVPEGNISNAATGLGDWTLGGTVGYVLADDNAVAGNLNLAYYPTLVLVCPDEDRTTSEIGQQSFATWKNAILNCEGLVTSVDENVAVSVTNVYPNPANETANVLFNVKEAGVATVEIINTVGQVVVSEQLGEVSGKQNVALNTANVANGMYIVKISVGENVTTSSLSIVK
jgi:thiol-disulfide isomerase/thioredoxin